MKPISRARRWILSVAILIAGLLGLAQIGHTALKTMTLDELVKVTTQAVHGKVIETRSFWAEYFPGEDLIVTEVTVRPISHLVGKGNNKPVKFRYLGGTVGDMSCVCAESPVITEGQEIVVFLSPHQMGFNFVYAHYQGKYDVIERDGVKLVRGIPGAPLRKTQTLREVGDQVKASLLKVKNGEVK